MSDRIKSIFVLAVLLTYVISARAEWIELSSTGAQPDEGAAFKVIAADEKKVEFEFKLSGFQLEDVILEGNHFQRIIMPRTGDLGETGLPELPALSRVLSMPPKCGARLEVIEIETWEREGLRIAPLQPPKMENSLEEPEFTWNRDFYARDEFYPPQNVHIGRPVIMRDLRLLPVDFFPLSYNPAAGILRVVKRMRLIVHFEGEGENPKLRNSEGISSSFRPLYRGVVLNFNDSELDEILSPKGGYLIISHPNLYNELEYLIQWKREKGHQVVWADLSSIGNTYYNIKNYIQMAYDTWEEPPEFLLLVGDVTGAYALAAEYYTGDVTDHKYSMLEGDDYFPDVQVGRISVASETQLLVIINKIIQYELNPFMGNTDWYKKGLMIACTSHISCKHTKQYIKQKLLDNDYMAVDTVWYTGGVNTWQISQSINSGVGWVNYRGYAGWGGWGSSQTNALINYWMLPMVTGMVCNTSDFQETECLAETFLRVGTTSTPKGGIAVAGPASLYTHTKWNNTIDMGFYAGVFDLGITTAGGALDAAKMQLWLDFPNNRGPGGTTNSVECYFHQYNTIGDPGVELWTYVPEEITAQFNNQIAVGTNFLPVTVTYSSGGEPVKEAYVCLTQNGEILDRSYTDDSGSIELMPAPFEVGDMILTITKHNHIPVHETITAVQEPVFVGFAGYEIDDDNSGASSGNGDGVVNPGETIELAVRLCNFGEDTACGVTAFLNTDDYYPTVIEDEIGYGDISPGDSIFGHGEYVFTVSPFAPDGQIIGFDLAAVISTGDTSNSVIEIPIGGPYLSCDYYWMEPDINTFQPGDTVEIVIRMINDGVIASGELQLSFMAEHPWLGVLESEATLGEILPGDTASNFTTPFVVATSADMVPGLIFDLGLTAVNSSGFSQWVGCPVQFGRGGVSHPVGPDDYGYFAFGIEDNSYSQCPRYQWINISGGEIIVVSSTSNAGGDIAFTQLPFTFRYYGQDFDRAAVGSNGWLAFDNNPVVYAYNTAIPSTLGSDAMIAPFWDDLDVLTGEVRKQYFSSYGIFVVAWNGVNIHNGATNTFEIVLFDPAVHPTRTGDGIIQFQYHTFSNSNSSENYATIGIEAPSGADGLEYTFANIYAPNAATLYSQRAIKFTTLIEHTNRPPVIFGTCPYELNSVEENETVVFKADAFDHDGDELTFQWFHGAQPVAGVAGKICPLTFTKAGLDTVTIAVSDGENGVSFDWIFTVNSLGVKNEITVPPAEFSLEKVAPNPFNPTLNISFAVAAPGRVKISIFNILGREVANLVDDELTPGRYKIYWDGANSASGLYLVRMEAKGFNGVQKALLLK